MDNLIKCPSFAFTHAFLSRRGGVSEDVYASLNCGPGSNDIPANVAENRRVAAKLISGSQRTPLLTCYQIHSAKVVEVTHDWGSDRPKADALVTAKPDLILGVLTADCTPVLFTDENAGVVGVAHAGWKGALTGVLTNTLNAMEKLGADRADIRTAIGPTIHQDSYEVGADFRAHFADTESGFASYFNKGQDVDHYQFDLPGFIEGQLRSLDVRHIWNARVDTYTSPNHFSYRRATHHKDDDYGRQLSGIMLPH